NLPGTEPPNVHTLYRTLSAIWIVFSITSRLTMTFVACVRVIAGGTFGASGNTATSWPTIGSDGVRTGTVLLRDSAASACVQLVIVAVPKRASAVSAAAAAARLRG